MEIIMTSDDLVSIQQAADALKKSRPTIYRWVETGKIQSAKFGGVYYIPRSEIERLK